MGRYKSLIGPRLRARGFAAQQTEAAIAAAVLNRVLAADARIPSVASRSSHSSLGIWGNLALRQETLSVNSIPTRLAARRI
jgi:hypothetical protein